MERYRVALFGQTMAHLWHWVHSHAIGGHLARADRVKMGLRKPLDDRAVFTQPRQCDPLVAGKGEKPSTMNSLIESGFDLRNPVMSGRASFRNEKMISRC